MSDFAGRYLAMKATATYIVENYPLDLLLPILAQIVSG